MGKAIRARLAELPADSVVTGIRKDFGNVAKIERVLLAKGDNAMVDACVFGGTWVENPNSKYPVYFLEDFEILNAPTDVDDVKGKVTADYQNYLEKEWIEELRAKYPVTVYDKVLKKIK